MNERILHKLSEARDCITLVEEKLPKTYEGFKGMSRLERDGIYKNIEFAIQSILDICAIILKEKDLKVPSSDDDMLTILKESKVFKSQVIDTIKLMKSFRNRLVHRYGDIDNELAYHNIKDGLKDFQIIFEDIKNIITADQ
ncbi:MAG: DUF86 domain-containing protein [Candidatus Thermoplasmatota archaeon]|nr:DUF86 domain-containing protein [Candidatus Thermoplasmatota archaeon]